MFFLENIPKNLVNIRKELQVKTVNHTKSSNSFNPRDFFGVVTNNVDDFKNLDLEIVSVEVDLG